MRAIRSYVGCVALKLRVMASHGPVTGKRTPLPPLIYRAEAYRDTDRFRETAWVCPHEHNTVEGALQCGQAWIGTQSETLTETA